MSELRDDPDDRRPAPSGPGADARGAARSARVRELDEHRVRWSSSTQRCDRPAAEAAVGEVYAAVGLPHPELVVWMDSPMGGLFATAVVRRSPADPAAAEPITEMIRDHFVHRHEDDFRSRSGGERWAGWWMRSRSLLTDRHDRTDPNRTATLIRHQLMDRLRGTHPHHGRFDADRWGRLVQVLRGRLQDRGTGLDVRRTVPSQRLRDEMVAQVVGSMDPGTDLYAAALHELAREAAGVGPAPDLDVFVAAVRANSWWWPMRGAVVLTDRPTARRVDDLGRLHCDGGPALEHADGFGVHVLRGLEHHFPHGCAE